jgi:hypothetical protein
MKMAKLERYTGPTYFIVYCHIAELIELILIFGETAGCTIQIT